MNAVDIQVREKSGKRWMLWLAAFFRSGPLLS
jgi:hypothetical protein